MFLVIILGMKRESSSFVCAIIGDVVGSRRVGQRPLFEALTGVLGWINGQLNFVHRMSLAPATGDEIQGACRSISEALKSTLFIQMKLHGQYQMRFGLGFGETDSPRLEQPMVERSGSAWWNARDALKELETLEGQKKGLPDFQSRTRLSVGNAGDPCIEALANSFLLYRDQAVQQMSRMDALVTLGLFGGQRQSDIAREQKISQSMVSTVSRKKGAALLIQCQQMLDEAMKRHARKTRAQR